MGARVGVLKIDLLQKDADLDGDDWEMMICVANEKFYDDLFPFYLSCWKKRKKKQMYLEYLVHQHNYNQHK